MADHLAQLRGWVQTQPDLTLAGLQQKLLEQAQMRLSIGRLWQLLWNLGLCLKKSIHAAERDTEANRQRRAEFLERSPGLRRNA